MFTLIKGYDSTLRARRSRVVERARGLFSAFVLVVLVGGVKMFAAEPSRLAECWSLRALTSVSSLHVEITLSPEERLAGTTSLLHVGSVRGPLISRRGQGKDNECCRAAQRVWTDATTVEPRRDEQWFPSYVLVPSKSQQILKAFVSFRGSLVGEQKTKNLGVD